MGRWVHMTYPGRLRLQTGEVDERVIDDVRAVADGERLVLQRAGAAHGDNLPQLLVLWGPTRGQTGSDGVRLVLTGSDGVRMLDENGIERVIRNGNV